MKSFIPPFFIEIREDDIRAHFDDVVQDMLKLAGHGNPRGLNYKLGDQHEIQGRNYIEFQCLAGSAWMMLVFATRRGVISRTIAHTIDECDGGGIEVMCQIKKCQKCSEAIEDQFDSCWKCGAMLDGTPHGPDVQPALTIAEILKEELGDYESQKTATLSILSSLFSIPALVSFYFIFADSSPGNGNMKISQDVFILALAVVITSSLTSFILGLIAILHSRLLIFAWIGIAISLSFALMILR